jgi:hypothetical protein
MGAGYAKEATDLGSAQSAIFFRTRLDDPNRVESSDEIGFYAHVIFGHPSAVNGARSARMPTFVIPGHEKRELRCAIAHLRISRFPDAQLRICGLILRTIPE